MNRAKIQENLATVTTRKVFYTV